jgi:phosphoglycolate phosphatase
MPHDAVRPLLVFDLDGTLVDSALDLMGTLNALLVREGLLPVPVEAVGRMVGLGARVLIERGLRANGVEPEPARVDRLFADFLVHYGDNIAVSTRPYPGVEAALDRFAAAGWRFAICTNKPEALSFKLLDALGLTSRFDAICGGDTFPVRKPDAAHLTGTIARVRGETAGTARAIMVGDSHADVAAARNAAVPVVGVSFGYTDKPMAELGPDVVIDHFDALWDAVAGLEKGEIGRA